MDFQFAALGRKSRTFILYCLRYQHELSTAGGEYDENRMLRRG
jgi:hypothetical protein